MKLLVPLTAALGLVSGMSIKPRGKRITDRDTLAQLQESHHQTIETMKYGNTISASNLDNSTFSGLQQRNPGIIVEIATGLFLALLEGVAGEAVNGVAGALGKIFFENAKQDLIWYNRGHCRVYYETQGGGNCHVKSFKKGSDDPTGVHDDFANCPWINPESTAPPVEFFEDEDGIGKFSIQMTATSNVAWADIEGTEKCHSEGLCNPQFVFYRDNHNIVLNTWQQQGDGVRCQYSGGEKCGGICNSRVIDQFEQNGVKWGGDCAIPCIDDDALPETGS